MSHRRNPRKEYRLSVYGEVVVKKRQLVKVKSPRYRIKQYYRTVRVREQRRWDLKGTKHELWTAVRYIKRRRASPKVRHKRISARVFLRNPYKWIDKYELEAPQAESPYCPRCGRRLYARGDHLICPVHGIIY